MTDTLRRSREQTAPPTAEIIPDPRVRANRRNTTMERNDIEWYVTEDGTMRLRFRETRFDALMKRIRRRQITQDQIDRLPDYIKRVAWGSCLLNYDYEGRYYLPKPSIHDYRPGDEDFEGHEPCTPAEAKAILKRYGLSSLMGVEVK